MLVGYMLAEALKLNIGDTVTLIGQTFDGGLATGNFTAVGFIRFGVFSMDKKMALIDLADAQNTFYMEDMATDWLGFLPANIGYHEYESIRANIEHRLPDLMRAPPQSWAKDDYPLILS